MDLMRRFIAFVALFLCASSFCWPASADSPTNLVKNGDLAAGVNGAPADWYALSQDRKLSKFSWSYSPATSGVLEISNLGRNLANWHQALMLRPGTYLVSAEAKVEGAMTAEGGANIAISTFDGLLLGSNRLQKNADWQTISFYLVEDRWGDSTELLCQLGFKNYPDTGHASFRNIKVVALEGSPPPAAMRFDLKRLRAYYNDSLHQPDNRISIRATGVVCGVILLGLLGWALSEIWRPALAAGRSAWMLPAGLMLAITAVKFAALFHFTGFYWDIWAKTNRALLAAFLGPSKIYDPGLPVDAYPPGSVYLLWLSGWIGGLIEPSANGFRVIVETPPLIADLFIGLTIYFAAWRNGRGTRALIIMMLFALNPGAHFRHCRVGSERFGRRTADGRRRDLDSHRPLPPRLECGRNRYPGQAAGARFHAAAGTVDVVQRGHCRVRVVWRRNRGHDCDWRAPVPARTFVGLDFQRI